MVAIAKDIKRNLNVIKMADKNKTNRGKKSVARNNMEAPTLTLSNTDRAYKDIAKWRQAIKAAENITHPRRKQLYDIYKEAMLDAHLISVTGKRRSKIVNSKILFFNSDGSINEEIGKLMETEAAEDMLKDIIDSRFWGHSLLWFNDISETINYTLIEREHVNPVSQEVLKQVHDLSGIKYNESPTNNYVLEAGKPKDLGLLVAASMWCIYKKGDVSDLALFAESFGNPFREYIYDDVTAKTALERSAKEHRAASYLVRPRNAEFKLHESTTKSGSSDLFLGFEELCDDQMSKVILHNTMTTDAKGGNYKGEVHEKSEKEVAKADKRFIIKILNEKFIPILENFGVNTQNGYFAYEDEDPLPIEKRFDIDMKFAERFEVEPEYFYKKYKIPIPESGAAFKEKPTENKQGIANEPVKTEEENKEQNNKNKKPKAKSRKLKAKIKRFFSQHP